jgi:uroporphyrinogen decarboxylase
MNSLERIMCAVSGNNADYQPFTLLLSLYGSRLIKTNTTDFYRNPEIWFEGQQAVVETFDPDIVLSPFALPIEAEAFGSELIFLDKFSPNLRKPFITDLSQINRIQLPDYDKSSSIQFLLKTTKLLADNYKGSRAIAAPINSPTDIPSMLMGVEMWIDTLLFHPDKVEQIMETTVKHFVHLGNELLAQGATFLVVPLNFTNPMIITEKIFANLYPYLEKAFSQINGPIVLHHGGCKFIQFIDRYVKLPNVIAFVLGHTENFDAVRQIVGEKTVLMGNIDGLGLANLTKEKAAETTLKILNNRIHDKHFIFASSNADIPYDTPTDIIKTVVETIRNFKKY